MGKLPRVTGQQAIVAFGKIGYVVDRVRGSHHILKHPQRKHALTVPVHGSQPLKRGLLRSLIRTADLTVEQFIDLL